MKNACPHCEYSGPPESFYKHNGDFNLYHVNLAACPRCGELLAYDMSEYAEWEFWNYEGQILTDVFLRPATIDDLFQLNSFDLDALGMMQGHIRQSRI